MSFQRLRLFQHQGVNSVHLTNSDSNATSKILFDVCYHPSPELRIQNSCSPVFLLDSCLISLDWESFALRKKTEKLRVENPAFPPPRNMIPSASAQGLSFPCSQSKRNSTILQSSEYFLLLFFRFSLFAALYPQGPARLLSWITCPFSIFLMCTSNLLASSRCSHTDRLNWINFPFQGNNLQFYSL